MSVSNIDGYKPVLNFQENIQVKSSPEEANLRRPEDVRIKGLWTKLLDFIKPAPKDPKNIINILATVVIYGIAAALSILIPLAFGPIVGVPFIFLIIIGILLHGPIKVM